MRTGLGVLLATMSIVAVAPAFTASPAAQSLDRVEELARVGQVAEARAMLLQWWETARDRASERDLQRGLWLRGKFTVDPDLAELDFQRLVVLYPSSPYAPWRSSVSPNRRTRTGTAPERSDTSRRSRGTTRRRPRGEIGRAHV